MFSPDSCIFYNFLEQIHIGGLMKSIFLCDVPNARLLRNHLDKDKGLAVEYVIERVICLSKRDFIPFREHLMEETPFVSCHKEDMFIDEQGVWHVLMFCCLQSDIILLVNSNGKDYAKYCKYYFKWR